MKSANRILLMAAMITTLIVGHASATPPKQSTPITIGAVLPTSGEMSSFGKAVQQGMDLAVKELNAKGGVKGRPITLIVEDDQGTPAGATTATVKLAQNPEVMAIVGEVASSLTMMMADAAQKNQVPLVTPAATHPKVTTAAKNYIFRTCVVDRDQGSAMAKFARKSLGLKRVAVLRNEESDYSNWLDGAFEQSFEGRLGGTISARESYIANSEDFRPQLKKIADSHPDALYVPGYYSDVIRISQQAREVGLKVPLLGGDGWASDKIFAASSALVGSYFTDHGAPDDPSPEFQAFANAFGKAYNGAKPDVLAAQGYLTVYVLADALSRAKQVTRADLRDALAKTRNLKTIGGPLTIDRDRNAQRPLAILRVADKRFVFKERVSP